MGACSKIQMSKWRLAHFLPRAWQQLSSRDAGSFRKTLALCGVLDRVLLQGCEVNKTLATPHALKLRLTRVHTLVLGQVLTLLEALVAACAFEGLLPRVNAAMALQLGRVPEALFTVGAFERLLPSRVTAVLDKLGG